MTYFLFVIFGTFRAMFALYVHAKSVAQSIYSRHFHNKCERLHYKLAGCYRPIHYANDDQSLRRLYIVDIHATYVHTIYIRIYTLDANLNYSTLSPYPSHHPIGDPPIPTLSGSLFAVPKLYDFYCRSRNFAGYVLIIGIFRGRLSR